MVCDDEPHVCGFPTLDEDLGQYIAPDASFVQEICQGHINDGERL